MPVCQVYKRKTQRERLRAAGDRNQSGLPGEPDPLLSHYAPAIKGSRDTVIDGVAVGAIFSFKFALPAVRRSQKDRADYLLDAD